MSRTVEEIRSQTIGAMTCACGRPMMLLSRERAMVCSSLDCGRLTWKANGFTWREMARAWPERLIEQARVRDFVPLMEAAER